MKFHKLTNTCKPEPNRDVIVRIAGIYDPYGDKVIPVAPAPYLYTVIRKAEMECETIYDEETEEEIDVKYHDVYREALGEGFASWLDCEISHWCYATDILEEIEEEE